MVRNIHKIVRLFVFLIIYQYEIVLSSKMFWDYDTFNNEYEDVKYNDNCDDCDEYKQNLKKKSADYSELPTMLDSTRNIPYYHSTQTLPCTCEMKYRLLDLGHKYFPRYVHTGVCKKETCGDTHRCIEKHYKVIVLKEKESNTDIQETVNIPNKLKDMWSSEFISVVVSCVCTPHL